MRISDLIAQYIMDMLEEDDSSDHSATIKRKELAETLGCVPSQINYVITSRFPPEQGYIVESRRGGVGYIKITRISMDKHTAVMHLMDSIGSRIDAKSASDIVKEMLRRNMIDLPTAKVISSAVSERPYQALPTDKRDELRAAIFKSMLLTL